MYITYKKNVFEKMIATSDTCEKSKEGPLENLLQAFSSVKLNGGNCDIAVLDACAAIAPLYVAVFPSMIASVLANDIGNSVKTARLHWDSTPNLTLQQLITNEVQTRGLQEIRKDKKSASIGILWMYRAAGFFVELLSDMQKNPSKQTHTSAQEIYAAKLYPYHAWFTSKIVGSAMKTCPWRHKLLENVGHTEESFCRLCNQFAIVIHPVIASIEETIQSNNINFDDKV